MSVGFGFWTHRCIPARCKEYQHTERSRSIQGVLEARGLRHNLDAQEGHESQPSLQGPEIQSCFLQEDLVDTQRTVQG